jgi:hypothetical protein
MLGLRRFSVDDLTGNNRSSYSHGEWAIAVDVRKADWCVGFT